MSIANPIQSPLTEAAPVPVTTAELLPDPPAEAAGEEPLLRVALSAVARRWRLVILGLGVGIAVGVPAALRTPLWFQAGVRLIPTPARQGGPRMPGFEPLDGATPEDITGPGGAQAAGELGRLLSILHSRSLTDDTIAHFGLMEVHHARTLEDMRELFWNRLASSLLVAKEGYVELSVEDLDPRRAAEIANYMSQEANRITRRLSSSAAAQERVFLEQRLGEARRQLDLAALELRRFSEQNKVINIEVQADGVMGMLLRLKEQLVAQEIELRRLQSFSSSDEPATAAARRQVRSLRHQIEDLQRSALGASADFFTRLEKVPGLRQEAERLQRDLREKAGVYEMLLRQFEMARLGEVRDTRSFEVLDAAVVPTRKSRPSRALVVLCVALLSALLVALLVAGRAAWRRLRPPRRAQLEAA